MILRIYYPTRAVFLGLLTTQILATIHVYHTNLDLHRTVSLLQETGYFVVPNALVASSLKAIEPALWGGLFFSLSLGAGLSLFALISAWTWDRVCKRNKGALVPFLLLWLVLIFAVNNRHISPMVTTYFVAVPLVVFAATLKMMPQEVKKRVWHKGLIPVLPIALLAIIWTIPADRFLFLDIRDILLLSNPIGKKVDAFYYKYTLYPANVLKTLEQKTLKTCRLGATEGRQEKKRIETLLMDRDYLPVAATESNPPVDLVVQQRGSQLVFQHKGDAVFDVSLRAFFAQPGEALRRFSRETDRNALFRLATIIGLLVGFPVLLYTLVFSVLHFATSFLLGSERASFITASLCFALGLALLAPLAMGRSGKIEGDKLPAALHSENRHQRVSALRAIATEQRDMAKIMDDVHFLTSSHLPERYWYAKALAGSHAPEAYDHLVQLLDDPHPNVISMAFYSLGQRRDRRAIKEILPRIESSVHWYNQWYAYRALRALGWRQNPHGYP